MVNQFQRKIEKQNLEKDKEAEAKEKLFQDFGIKSERIHTLTQLLKAYTLFEKDEDGNSKEFHYPIYRETKGVTSKWMYHAVNKIVASGIVKEMPDYIPEDILRKYNLPKLSTALVWIHMPKNQKNSSLYSDKKHTSERSLACR